MDCEAQPSSPLVRPRTSSVWSNTEDGVKKQTISFAADSAATLRSTLQYTPFPPGCDGRQLEKKYRLADNRQTRLIQDAYSAANELTILRDEDQLYRLEKAENAELLLASGQGKFEGDALPPRAVAVTIAIDVPKLANHLMLLDAAAFLARVGAPEMRCTRTVRTAFLTGNAARKYGFACAQRAQSTRVSANVTAQLCVSWAVLHTDENTKNGFVRSEVCEIAYCATALEYFNELRSSIARLLSAHLPETDALSAAHPSVLTATRNLFTSMDAESDAVSGAYQAGALETNDEFWKLLVHRVDEKLSWESRPPDEFLCFDEEKVFLKLVPRGRELDHPEVFHGLLLYKQGMHRETLDHCIDSMKEERNTPNRHPSAPWGLRPPESKAAEEMHLHILSIHAELIPLGEVASAFGLAAVAGQRFCVHPNCSTPRLVFRLVPFDDQFASQTFALPCDQNLINPYQADRWLPLWAFTEDAIMAYPSLFPPEYDQPIDGISNDFNESSKSNKLPFSLTKHIAPPTEEDELMRTLLGMPFGVAAFRLGDPHTEVERLQNCPHLTTFLLAAIAELGPDAPIAQAFNTLTDYCTKHRSELAALNKTIQSLKVDTETAQAEAESARKRIKVAVEEAAANVSLRVPEAEPMHAMHCSIEQTEVMLRGVGVAPVEQVTLKLPLKGGRIVAIVRAFGRAAGLAINDDVSSWSKKNATGTHFTAIDTVARTLAHTATACEGAPRPLLLAQVGKEVQFYDLDFIDGDFVKEAIAPIDALHPERASLTWILWNDDDATLTPLVPIENLLKNEI